jgi:hypothetical protein
MSVKRVGLGMATRAGFSGGLEKAPASEGGRYKAERAGQASPLQREEERKMAA